MECVFPYCQRNLNRSNLFFEFPADEGRREQWIQSLPVTEEFPEIQVREDSLICSDHFEADSFDPITGLKDGAFPSLFFIIEGGPVNIVFGDFENMEPMEIDQNVESTVEETDGIDKTEEIEKPEIIETMSSLNQQVNSENNSDSCDRFSLENLDKDKIDTNTVEEMDGVDKTVEDIEKPEISESISSSNQQGNSENNSDSCDRLSLESLIDDKIGTSNAVKETIEASVDLSDDNDESDFDNEAFDFEGLDLTLPRSKLLQKLCFEISNIKAERKRLLYQKKREAEVKSVLQRLEDNEIGLEELSEIKHDLKSRNINKNNVNKKKPEVKTKTTLRKARCVAEIISDLLQNRLLSDSAAKVLFDLFGDISLTVNPLPENLSIQFSCFLQMLIFYCSKALDRIKRIFDVSLPTVEELREIFNNESGRPGWCHPAFKLLENCAKSKPGSKMMCSLSMGKLNLKEEEDWDGENMHGYIDVGLYATGPNKSFLDSDCIPAAQWVLILFVTPLEQKLSWKIPVAYFFVNNLNPEEKANVVQECLWRLHSVNAIVVSLSMNSYLEDRSTLESLGVRFDQLPHVCPYFVHPADAFVRVHVMFDTSKLIQSIKNMWFSCKVLKDGKGRIIDWSYVIKLIEFLKTQAFPYAEDENEPYMCWKTDNLDKRILSKLFTFGAADAMNYCVNRLQLFQFLGCNGTSNFMTMMAKVIAVLNLRCSSANRDIFNPSFLIEALQYIFTLHDQLDSPLHLAESGRPMYFLYVNLLSLQAMQHQFPQFPSHRLSMNHMHVFSYIISSFVDWRKFPTSRQFTGAMKRYIGEKGYQSSWSTVDMKSDWTVDHLDVLVAHNSGCIVPKPVLPTIDLQLLSKENVEINNQLISISVVKSIAEILQCNDCLLALTVQPLDTPFSRVMRESCIGIAYPSRDVEIICEICERRFWEVLRFTNVVNKKAVFEGKDKQLLNTVFARVLYDVVECKPLVFNSLKPHVLECPFDSNHVYRLVRAIVSSFVQIRLKNLRSLCDV